MKNNFLALGVTASAALATAMPSPDAEAGMINFDPGPIVNFEAGSVGIDLVLPTPQDVENFDFTITITDAQTSTPFVSVDLDSNLDPFNGVNFVSATSGNGQILNGPLGANVITITGEDDFAFDIQEFFGGLDTGLNVANADLGADTIIIDIDTSADNTFTSEVTFVPEPTSALLLAGGLVVAATRRRRNRY